ncbi:MAG: hypothetical protein ACW99Q_11010 [Candidatus Kariarchaeaceae archaeon]|jgi:hypothetical protein
MSRNLNVESVELNYSPDPTFSGQPQPFPPPISEGEIRKRLVGHQYIYNKSSRKVHAHYFSNTNY